MGYTSTVGFSIVSDLEVILDTYHKMKNKADYSVNVISKDAAIQPPDFKIPIKHWHYADMLNYMYLVSHDKNGSSVKPNEKKIDGLFSLVFFCKHIKWRNLGDTYQDLLSLEKKPIVSFFYRQGEDNNDYEEEAYEFDDSVKSKIPKDDYYKFDIFNTKSEPVAVDDDEDIDERIKISFKKAIGLPLFENKPAKLNNIEAEFLKSLPLEKRIFKAIEYNNDTFLNELIDKNIELFKKDNFKIRILNSISKNYIDHFSDTYSKKTFLETVKLFLNYNIFTLNELKVSPKLNIEEEKKQWLALEKNYLIKNVTINKIYQPIKL